MSHILGFLGPLFWGIVVLSLLVFVHEGGHYLAARLCHVRVTEFFLGMPCRYRLAHTSKKIGTTFGVTPILLGGYAAICGMEPINKELAAHVLSYINSHGHASVEELVEQFDCSSNDIEEVCVSLLNMASIAPFYDEDEKPNPRYYPTKFQTVARDSDGNTVFEGKRFDSTQATAEGSPFFTELSPEEFFEQEQSHTYQGKGFIQRVCMLLAGIAVNLITGFLLMIVAFSIFGVTSIVDSNQIAIVEPGSLAQDLGMKDNDTITSVNGVTTTSWQEVLDALTAARDEGKLTIEFSHAEHGNEPPVTATCEFGKDMTLGIQAQTQTVRLNIAEASKITFAMIYETLINIIQLINPQHTVEILDNSTSIIGISVMSAQAASMGPMPLLSLAAAISFSLAFMNLLPIPPLDGGKLIFEVYTLIFKKEVPIKVQTIISYVGIAIFGLLFLYMLRADVLRFIL